MPQFQQALSSQLGISIHGTPSRCCDLFEAVMKESQRRHFTLVIDEFEDLKRCSSSIFSKIQDVWNRYHASSRLNLIACGKGKELDRHHRLEQHRQ